MSERLSAEERVELQERGFPTDCCANWPECTHVLYAATVYDVAMDKPDVGEIEQQPLFSPPLEPVPCPICHGRGFRHWGGACAVCEGTGKVEPIDPQTCDWGGF